MGKTGSFGEIASLVAASGIAGIWTDPDTLAVLGREKGAYLLSIRLERAVPADGLARFRAGFAPGDYVYAGSAYGPGGMAARLRRHFRKDKRLRWHVDRLTVAADRVAALALAGGNECALVEKLLAGGAFRIAAKGFGSSDCRRCESHLLTV